MNSKGTTFRNCCGFSFSFQFPSLAPSPPTHSRQPLTTNLQGALLGCLAKQKKAFFPNLQTCFRTCPTLGVAQLDVVCQPRSFQQSLSSDFLIIKRFLVTPIEMKGVISLKRDIPYRLWQWKNVLFSRSVMKFLVLL